MKNKWTLFLRGYVELELEGVGAERFLNECVKRDMLLWDIKRIDENKVRGNILLQDIPKLYVIRRNHTCHVRFLKRKGLPFFFKKSLVNSGIAAGIVLFLLVITLFSNMVLKVEIKGAKPETEMKITKELNRLGVSRGKLQSSIADIEEIQRNLTNNISSITWVGVELKGTTFHLKVVEKNEPKKEKIISPQNLIASKEAVITKMYVKIGKPMVMVNDHVEKGQLLVSGAIGSEEKPFLLPAQGVVYGETWYTTRVNVPLFSKLDVLTDKQQVQHYLKINGLTMKIWGFAQEKYKMSKMERMPYQLRFLKWKLPVYYEKVIEKERDILTRRYTEGEAKEVAKEIAEKNLKKMLDKHATIKAGNVLEEKLSSSNEWVATYHFKVIENIAKVQPLVNIPKGTENSE